MAAGNWIMYDNAKLEIAKATIDLDSHTFKVMLTTSSYTPSRGSHTVKADVTNEVANGNGYTTGGAALTSVAVTNSSGTTTFDAADPAWTASGGSLVFRNAVIYDDTHASDALLAYCVLDTANVTVADGQIFTLQLNASGILTFSGATS